MAPNSTGRWRSANNPKRATALFGAGAVRSRAPGCTRRDAVVFKLRLQLVPGHDREQRRQVDERGEQEPSGIGKRAGACQLNGETEQHQTEGQRGVKIEPAAQTD